MGGPSKIANVRSPWAKYKTMGVAAAPIAIHITASRQNSDIAF